MIDGFEIEKRRDALVEYWWTHHAFATYFVAVGNCSDGRRAKSAAVCIDGQLLTARGAYIQVITPRGAAQDAGGWVE